MYFLMGFLVMLSVFLSMQASTQEQAAREMAVAYQKVKEAEAVYPNQQASYLNAYKTFDRLIEEGDVRAFPDMFTGRWIPEGQYFSRPFIEINEDGTLTRYRAPNGASCYRADHRLELIRYSDSHYVAVNKHTHNRFTLDGDEDALQISNIHMVIRPDTTNYVRIDYRENDDYKRCKPLR